LNAFLPSTPLAYSKQLHIFDVALVMATAPRGWRSFDISSPLLIYVSKGERVSLASLASAENFIIREGLVAARYGWLKPIHRYRHIA
jgi:hypothetical protein